jgi:hypothetical protein
MFLVVRRVGIAIGSFVIAWLVVSFFAGWLFGSGNILVWVLAAAVGAGVYLEILRRDRRLRPSGAGSSHDHVTSRNDDRSQGT